VTLKSLMEKNKTSLLKVKNMFYARQGKKLANGISHGIKHLHQRRDVMQ